MSDLAWREGMADWQPIHSFSDIEEAVLPPVPSSEPMQQPKQPTPTLPPPIPVQSPTIPLQAPPSSESSLKATDTTNHSNQTESDKLRAIAVLLCLFLGGLGLHAFYAGRNRQGVGIVALLLTGCLFNAMGGGMAAFGGLCYLCVGLITLITVFRIALGKYKDGQGKTITKWI